MCGTTYGFLQNKTDKPPLKFLGNKTLKQYMNNKECPELRNPTRLKMLFLPWAISIGFVSLSIGLFMDGTYFYDVSLMFFGASSACSFLYLILMIVLIYTGAINNYYRLLAYQLGLVVLTNLLLILIFGTVYVTLPSIPYFIVGLLIQFFFGSFPKLQAPKTLKLRKIHDLCCQ